MVAEDSDRAYRWSRGHEEVARVRDEMAELLTAEIGRASCADVAVGLRENVLWLRMAAQVARRRAEYWAGKAAHLAQQSAAR